MTHIPFRLENDPGPPNGLTPYERHNALMGQMRSLASLAEWETLSDLCSREWRKSEPHMRCGQEGVALLTGMETGKGGQEEVPCAFLS